MASDFAEEQMGWTATPLAKADRIAEAEHLYQDAIGRGENTLAPSALARPDRSVREPPLHHGRPGCSCPGSASGSANRYRPAADLPATAKHSASVAEFTPPNGDEKTSGCYCWRTFGNRFNDVDMRAQPGSWSRGVDLYSQMTEEDRASTPNVMQAAQMFARLVRDLNDQLQARPVAR